MGTSANENIAIAVTTTADLTGTTAARKDVTALGEAARAAQTEVAASATAGAEAESSLAGAAARAAGAHEGLARSTMRSTEAFARLAMSAASGGTGLERAARAAGMLSEEVAESAGASGLMAVQIGALAVLLVTFAEAAHKAWEAWKDMPTGKVAPEMQQHIDALKTEVEVTDALKAAQGKLAADEAEEARLKSANYAAWLLQGDKQQKMLQAEADDHATINALLAKRAKITHDDSDEMFKTLGALDLAAQESSDRLAMTDEQAEASRIRRQKDRDIVEFNRAHKSVDEQNDYRIAAEAAADAEIAALRKKANDELDRQNRSVTGEALDTIAEGNATQLRGAADRASQAQQQAIDAIRKHARADMSDLTALTDEARQALAEAAQASEDAEVKRVQTQAKSKNDALDLEGDSKDPANVQKKAAMRVAIAVWEDAQIRAIRRKSANDLSTEDARLLKESTDAQRESLDSLQHEFLRSVDTAVRAKGDAADALTKLALEPIEKELEALAAKALVDATLAAAAGDFGGAALYVAGAAAATLAARTVAALAGGGGGGDSGGGSAGGGAASAGSGATLFSPQSTQQGGGTTVVIQTVDPNSRSVIQNTIYQINRSGQLQRPVFTPSLGPSGFPSVAGG